MFDVGWSEATVILLLALLLFGPDKLAEFAKTLGRLYGEYKTARRRLELELLYGKEVVDKEYIRDLAKLKLENPVSEFTKVVDFSTANLSTTLSPEFKKRVFGQEELFVPYETPESAEVKEVEEEGDEKSFRQ